jgi:broad specificity phosphatase PhoE
MQWWQSATGPWWLRALLVVVNRSALAAMPGSAKLIGFLLAALTISLVIMPALAAEDADEAWEALVKGGHVALIRHGNAPPGFGGDPPGFKFEDCKTQRNLDDKGRAQGTALGEAFRGHGVRVDRIVSSPVCRCMDTASLMAVGQVESSWALVPDRDTSAPVRLRELKEIVSNWRGPGTLVLVTHGFTIRPLIGIIPDQAETVVLRPTPGIEPGAHVVGRIAPPQ